MRRGPAVFLLFLVLFGSAYGAWRAGPEGYNRLTQFQPEHRSADRPTIGSAPLAQRLVLIMIDGLSTEEAHLLPSLDWMRRRGAAYRLSVPGTSNPGAIYTTLLSGAPPTRHGGLGLVANQPPPVDHLPESAKRAQVRTGGAGGPNLGRLVSTSLETWYEGSSLAELSDEITTLVQPGGPRLVLIQVEDLAEAPSARDAMAELDRHLVTILDQVDWNHSAVMVVGSTPTTEVPLLLAGSGVTPGAGGDATLLDLAPTAAALLGLPTPLETQGGPILSALRIEGRPLDAIVQVYLSSRRADTATILQAYGATLAPEEPPATSAEAADYLARLDQQIKEAQGAWMRVGVMERLPYLGGGILILLLYLLILYTRPFGRAAFWGHLTYTLAFQSLFFALGGRYGSDLDGLGLPLSQLGLRFGLASVGAVLLSSSMTGLLLSRQELKRSRYLAAYGLHTTLGLVVVTALPMAVVMLLIGWDFPVELPPVGLWIWFLLTVLQVMVMGGLSPIWTVVTVWAARLGQQHWPIKEIGNPEVNADKVVRLQAIRRADRRRSQGGPRAR